nr:hypothetical protein BaRGS_032264 [Batillaria attramentaria]
MLHEKRHLKELNMAGNRLLSLSVDLDPHKDLELLDLSHNMLTTLLADERQALDSLASRHPIRLKLRGNPLLCACSNLDFLRWVWSTAVQLDGEGRGARNFTCTTEEGVDEWLCGFTVQQAQRSITDTMPDRVIVVFMEDPARLPPMALARTFAAYGAREKRAARAQGHAPAPSGLGQSG